MIADVTVAAVRVRDQQAARRGGLRPRRAGPRTSRAVVGRFHNVYGPRMGADHVIPEMSLRALRRRGPVPRCWGADQRRAFCYVDDAVEAMLRLMDTPGRRRRDRAHRRRQRGDQHRRPGQAGAPRGRHQSRAGADAGAGRVGGPALPGPRQAAGADRVRAGGVPGGRGAAHVRLVPRLDLPRSSPPPDDRGGRPRRPPRSPPPDRHNCTNRCLVVHDRPRRSCRAGRQFVAIMGARGVGLTRLPACPHECGDHDAGERRRPLGPPLGRVITGYLVIAVAVVVLLPAFGLSRRPGLRRGVGAGHGAARPVRGVRRGLRGAAAADRLGPADRRAEPGGRPADLPRCSVRASGPTWSTGSSSGTGGRARARSPRPACGPRSTGS